MLLLIMTDSKIFDEKLELYNHTCKESKVILEKAKRQVEQIVLSNYFVI